MPPVKASKGRPLPRLRVRIEERDQKRSPRTQEPFARRLLHVLVLAVLLAVIAAPTLLPKFSVVDNDIWFHLKVGDWIVAHSAFPHSGILSRTAAERPWAAYSWIYELLLSFLHSRFHLQGIAVYGLLLTITVAFSVFWMTRRAFRLFLEAVSAGHFHLRGISLQGVVNGTDPATFGIPFACSVTASSQTMKFVAVPSQPWFGVSPGNGTLAANGSETIQITAVNAATVNGRNIGVVTLSAPGYSDNSQMAVELNCNVTAGSCKVAFSCNPKTDPLP